MKIDKGALIAVLVIVLHSTIPLIVAHGFYHGWLLEMIQ